MRVIQTLLVTAITATAVVEKVIFLNGPEVHNPIVQLAAANKHENVTSTICIRAMGHSSTIKPLTLSFFDKETWYNALIDWILPFVRDTTNLDVTRCTTPFCTANQLRNLAHLVERGDFNLMEIAHFPNRFDRKIWETAVGDGWTAQDLELAQLKSEGAIAIKKAERAAELKIQEAKEQFESQLREALQWRRGDPEDIATLKHQQDATSSAASTAKNTPVASQNRTVGRKDKADAKEAVDRWLDLPMEPRLRRAVVRYQDETLWNASKFGVVFTLFIYSAIVLFIAASKAVQVATQYLRHYMQILAILLEYYFPPPPAPMASSENPHEDGKDPPVGGKDSHSTKHPQESTTDQQTGADPDKGKGSNPDLLQARVAAEKKSKVRGSEDPGDDESGT